MSANLRYTHPKANRDNVDPGKTLVYVKRDGAVVWGGILWSVRKQKGSDYVSLGCSGVWSYFRKRRFRHSMTWSNKDQFYIFNDMVRYAQGDATLYTTNPGSYSSNNQDFLALQYGTTGTSGVSRDKKVRGWERKHVGSIAEALADLDNGFDFFVDVTEDTPNSFTHTLNLYYPNQGRETNFVFEEGKNVVLFDWSLDAWRLENRVDGLGAGEGPRTLIQTAQDTASLEAGYPLLDGVAEHKDATRSSTVLEHAQAQLRERKMPQSIPRVLLRPTEEGEIGGFTLGDIVTVRADDGFVQFDDRFRILKYTVDVSNEGDEEMDITLGEQAAAER